ncbi:MAG: hypothetical protein KDJ72_06800 [Methyloceanibacter sp.]|uniref:DUF5677 domain-containing protein n=1 Tax=Methyloceanibacter sp. TaxID=1965321 RepID=UPI001DDA5008|nr:DUF5677 domain-containing protein [Methyloceanibacter sp.]MCB1442715.1 hypothetical protein [Methyloceanibacter sp.]MCC0057650.1 hypothetical protein [Hyphomicrobiaceae bacterium]
MADSFVDNLNEVSPAPVDDEVIATFTSEDDFNELTVELLKEVGSFVCIAASALPADTKRWSRNQAIYGGHLVRLFKLISTLLDQTCQLRRETTFIVSRLAYETAVNLAYLIENGSNELFDDYIRYSLRQEKKLYELIETNIAERGGIRLPIEDRMLASISAAATKSGFSITELSPTEPKSWSGKNLRERAKSVGLEPIYLAAFGGGSQHVHGNWMDLLEYHLDEEGDGFVPSLEWHRPRPQIGLAIALVTTDVVSRFFRFVEAFEEVDGLEERLGDLWNRVRRANVGHERFLSSRTGVS